MFPDTFLIMKSLLPVTEGKQYLTDIKGINPVTTIHRTGYESIKYDRFTLATGEWIMEICLYENCQINFMIFNKLVYLYLRHDY